MTKLQIFTLSAWVLYMPYHFMSQRWFVDSNIRTDIVLIYLLLALLTLAVVIQWLIKQYKLRRR